MKAESAEVAVRRISGEERAPGYLVYGEEAYWHERLISALSGAMSGGAETLSSGDTTWDSLRDVLAQPSFFGPQLWVVRDAQELLKASDERYIETISPGTCLVLSCGVKDNPATKQFMGRWETLGGALVQAAEPSFSEASRWVSDRLRKEGFRIASDALETLIVVTGRSLERLDKEVDKLIVYIGKPHDAGRPTVEITTQVVSQVASADPEKTPFGFIDAVAARNAVKAFSEYRDLEARGANPVMVVSLLASHFGLVWRAKEAEPKRLSQDQLAKALGVHSYAAKKAAAEARNWTFSQLENVIRTLCTVDENLKRGRMDPDRAMDFLLSKVCRS